MGPLVELQEGTTVKAVADGSSTQHRSQLYATSQAAFHLFRRLTSMLGPQSAHTLRLTITSLVADRLLPHIPVLPISLRGTHLLLSPRLRTLHSLMRSHQSTYLNGSSLAPQMRNSTLDMCYRRCKKSVIGASNMKVTGHRFHYPRPFP